MLKLCGDLCNIATFHLTAAGETCLILDIYFDPDWQVLMVKSPKASAPTFEEVTITSTEELKGFCASLEEGEFITVDTEFMREKTYFAELCLIQIASPTTVALIDPLSKGMDLTPLKAVFANPKILKVLHAGRQDVEIFNQLFQAIPSPLYDTQLAASVLGFGDSIGYDSLVQSFVGKQMDKSSRFTDWSRRPLDAKQLSYARGDVTYLRTIFEKISEQIEKKGRTSWISEEMKRLMDPNSYSHDPRTLWKKIKIRGASEKVLARLRELAAWRDELAQSRNVPRGRIIKDDALAEIAMRGPSSEKEFRELRLFKNFSDTKLMHAMVDCISMAEASPKETWPKIPKKPDLSDNQSSLLEAVRMLHKIVSTREGISQRLLASQDDLRALVTKKNLDDLECLTGWRKEAFGQKALDLLAGKLTIGIRDYKVTFVES